jgi:hypothetical protein
MQTEELQTPATYALLQEIFKQSMKPLFIQIMQKLSNEFKEEYMTHRVSWHLKQNIVHGIEDVEAFWNKEENLKSVTEITFEYAMFGLRKAGTENYNENISLKFWMDTYWYGFSLVNHENGQPFLKKLYHQQLTKEEMQSVIDLIITKVLDRIEWAIEHFEGKNKKS